VDAPLMMGTAMTDLSHAEVLHALVGLGVGTLLGLLYFALLRWNTRIYTGGRVALGLVAQAFRFALAAGVLFALAHLGAGALLSGTIGLLGARHLVLRHVGGVSWARR